MTFSIVKKNISVVIINDLLKRYNCPVPFHQFRTILIGFIISPIKSMPPLEIIKKIWGGKLPNFENIDQLSSFMNDVFMSYWNNLTDHRNSKLPFYFSPIKIKESDKSLSDLCRIRREEIGGLLFGLMSGDENNEFSQTIQESIAHLEEIWGYFEATYDLIQKNGIGKNQKEISNMTFLLKDMEKIAQIEINELINNCAIENHTKH